VALGTWIGLYSRLNKTFKKIKKDSFDSLPFNENFYRNITNKNIIKILNPIGKLRNDIVHGGTIDESDAEEAIKMLEPNIHEVYSKLMVYNSLDLIYPLYMKKQDDENYNIHVKKLEGALYPFSEEDIFTKSDMISEVLYLYDAETDDRLKLNTNFINLYKCPECWNWSLYIYNKIDKATAIYISYQTEKHDHKGPEFTIKQLLDIPDINKEYSSVKI